MMQSLSIDAHHEELLVFTVPRLLLFSLFKFLLFSFFNFSISISPL